MTAAPMLSARADDRPSIAVLPFRMSASDPRQAYFEDGIIEGIVHVLSGLDGLFVVSRGSALAFARLRITTELSETARGTILRNDRYDGEADDLFEVQDRIAERVATTILPQVKAEELARAMRKPPTSMTAYDLVLRAPDEMRRLDQDAMLAARRLLDQGFRRHRRQPRRDHRRRPRPHRNQNHHGDPRCPLAPAAPWLARSARHRHRRKLPRTARADPQDRATSSAVARATAFIPVPSHRGPDELHGPVSRGGR